MGNRDYLKLGSYNAICDRCGFKYKSEELQKEWTGLMVCHLCFEHRHPQDFIRSKPDQLPLPWTRPEPTDTFIRTQAQDINCSVQEFRWYDSPFTGDITIIKGRVRSPLIVTGGTTTIICELDIV